MRYLLIVISLFLFISAEAKNQPQTQLHRHGLLKKISCVFSGVKRTDVGPSVGSVDFPTDLENTVCDPLSNNSSPSPDLGLLGKLILRTPAMGEKVTSVMDYFYKGQRLSEDLFFADVNVPTRSFDQGFATQSGAVLVDAQGNKLIEHFAIEYSSSLKLADTDKEGEYELAILSDDGARVFIKENDKWNELINNDGVHPTRMGCPYRTVNLKKGTEIPLRILYFQGPRYHIANVLLWKHHKKAREWKNPARHSFCGLTGNSFFFRTKGTHKTAAMSFLETSGWRVVAPQNFKMPEKKPNPCTEPDLLLSEFKLVSVQGTSATVAWKTNLPASSQLRIVNVYTGEQLLTDVDTTQVTDHQVQINGLVSGLFYQVQAISVDSKGREVRSGLVNILP